MILLDGKKTASDIKEEIALKVRNLKYCVLQIFTNIRDIY